MLVAASLPLGLGGLDVAAVAAPAPACPDAVEEAQKALASDDAASPEARNALHAHLARAVSAGPACAAAVDDVLAQAKCSRPGYGVVASAAFGSASFEPSRIAAHVARSVRELRAGDDACLRAVAPAVQHAARVDGAVASALDELASVDDENAPRARLLALGSVAYRARASGDEVLATRVEGELARELRTNADRLLALEAAGNAGCGACMGDIDRALRDEDDVVRRTAVAALRHQTAPRAVGAMCARLRQDESVAVREHAAWSMGFSDTDAAQRTACLEAAVTSDADDDVRRSAVRALGQLSTRSTLAEEAVARLERSPNHAPLAQLARAEAGMEVSR